jgi:hypothetical protein
MGLVQDAMGYAGAGLLRIPRSFDPAIQTNFEPERIKSKCKMQNAKRKMAEGFRLFILRFAFCISRRRANG